MVICFSRKLEERETLAARVRFLEHCLAERDEEIKVLTRNNALIEKNSKYRLAQEHKKLKDVESKHNIMASDSVRGVNIVEVFTLIDSIKKTN